MNRFLERGLAVALLMAGAALAPSTALAQHAGDIFPGVLGSRIVIENGLVAPNGRKLFEGDFRDFANGPFVTDDPGFDAAPDTFANGTQIWFRGVGNLGFWNGSAWVNAPSPATVTVTDAFGDLTTFSGSGVLRPEGPVGQAVSGAELHEHLLFSLVPGAGSPVGAYLLALQLTSRTPNGTQPGQYDDSDPFYIALNAGLSFDAFEAAVAAVGAVGTTVIPVPGSLALLAGGLVSLGVAVRRRRSLA
jgi:hypothetical protein